LCCVLLSAHITEEEADRFCEEQELKRENFCHIEEKGPNEGELVINMPCRRLLGRPASHVSCQAYGSYRPAVCGSYLCRVAVQYKAGLLTLKEALKEIRKAYRTGRVSYFNWVQTDEEGMLQRASLIPALLERAREIYSGFEDPNLELEDVENVFVAEAFTPIFNPASPMAHFQLNMLLDIFDRGELEITDLLDAHVLRSVLEEDRKFVEAVALEVVKKIRSLFRKEEL
jgi:hypothetical protein